MSAYGMRKRGGAIVFVDEAAELRKRLTTMVNQLRRTLELIAQDRASIADFIKIRERAWTLANKPELRGQVERQLDQITEIGAGLEAARMSGDELRQRARNEQIREARQQQREIDRRRPR